MAKNKNKPETRMALFKGSEVRKTIYNNEWWFSSIDVIGTLTDSANPRDYWYKMKFVSTDGKIRKIGCANTEGIFRIIQSEPSPKAEPFQTLVGQGGL